MNENHPYFKEAQKRAGLVVGGKWTLNRVLDVGGMAAVYEATHRNGNRVAMKVLHNIYAKSEQVRQRFLREGYLANKVGHPGAVSIQDDDVLEDGTPFLVMELLEGESLESRLRSNGPLPPAEVLFIADSVLGVLASAHDQNLIHRDIKPANIVLTQDGIAKLADLGMARQTNDMRLARRERGRMIGTPYYMAPEQVQGREDIDEQADLYSLGATFYHMVTGQPPFPGDELEPVLEGHLYGELTPPDHINQQLTGGLGEVVEWLLAKKRKDRYRSAADLLIDLECLLEGKAPRLARSKIEANTLQGLAEGEAIDDGDELEPPTTAVSQTWLLILATLLGISVLVNLVLLLR